jgi:tetratricopeptide (TPR) repeat protein
MKRIEKTVFISYRRRNIYMARSIYDNLTHHGYDVFFDYESIASGDFSQNILQSIESRAHFLLILTPSALERCSQPNDWLRREIEHAIKFKRNIVPLTFEGFVFSEMWQYLPEHIAEPLSMYNALQIPADYFDEAMGRLREKFLNISLDMVLHPRSQKTVAIEDEQKYKADAAPKVTEAELLAEELTEQAHSEWLKENDQRAIVLASEALTKQKEYALAFAVRAVARSRLKNYDDALIDADEALSLEPNNPGILCNKGLVYADMKRYDAAIQTYTKSLQIDPYYAIPYNNRGIVYFEKGNYDAAIADYDNAIQLDPGFIIAYNNRGNAYNKKCDYDAAIADYNTAINLNPNGADPYNNRGLVYQNKGDSKAALADYEKALEINPYFTKARNNLLKLNRELKT